LIGVCRGTVRDLRTAPGRVPIVGSADTLSDSRPYWNPDGHGRGAIPAP